MASDELDQRAIAKRLRLANAAKAARAHDDHVKKAGELLRMACVELWRCRDLAEGIDRDYRSGDVTLFREVHPEAIMQLLAMTTRLNINRTANARFLQLVETELKLSTRDPELV